MIDLSGLFSLEPDVPLVVPDVNPFVLADYRNRNIIAVPNSLTSQLLTALKPLIDDGGLSRISVTSLLSASANGKKSRRSTGRAEREAAERYPDRRR